MRACSELLPTDATDATLKKNYRYSYRVYSIQMLTETLVAIGALHYEASEAILLLVTLNYETRLYELLDARTLLAPTDMTPAKRVHFVLLQRHCSDTHAVENALAVFTGERSSHHKWQQFFEVFVVRGGRFVPMFERRRLEHLMMWPTPHDEGGRLLTSRRIDGPIVELNAETGEQTLRPPSNVDAGSHQSSDRASIAVCCPPLRFLLYNSWLELMLVCEAAHFYKPVQAVRRASYAHFLNARAKIETERDRYYRLSCL